MKMDAGTLLVSSCVITEPQLKQALGARVNRGGTLIENLVWLGHANDIEVAHTLAMQLGLPKADASQLQNLPTFVTRLLPLEIVRNHHLVPIMLDQGVLHVAMSDPTERAALEEVAFATGYIAAPVITPVNVLRAAMARYYSFDPMEFASGPSANGASPAPPATLTPAASLPVVEHGAEFAGEGSVEPAAGELEELFRSGREDSVVQLTQFKIPGPLRSAGDIAEAVLLNMVDEKGHPAPVADIQKDSSSRLAAISL